MTDDRTWNMSASRPQDPNVGDSFKETETGRYYVYTDEGWTEATPDEATSAHLRSAGRRLIDTIHAFERDPATEEWGRALIGRVVAANQQSTSAKLRQTQADLAASQQDLTLMEAERDALAVLNAELKAEAREWRAQADHWLTKARETGHELAQANHRNRILAAENAAALRALGEKERHD
jgi:hypothetical protein